MFSIDKNLCIDCGMCVKVCPMGVFYRKKDGALAIGPTRCLSCFHCTAICPTGAITHENLGKYTCLPLPKDDGSLLSKLQRRRSIRNFKPDVPDKAIIQSALDGAAYAPSAKNDRTYQWTVLLGEAVQRAHQIYLDWAKTVPELRHLVWLNRRGVNPITCGAPCLVLVHCGDDCSNPTSDSIIAATLAEQLLNDAGLGTCWGGYFHRAAGLCPGLQEMLGLPEGHQVHAVLMVGYPDEHYRQIPVRPTACVNWLE